MRTTHVVAVSLLAIASSVAPAQSTKEPRRPKLAAGADTNDAHAYYDFAMSALSDAPDRAADALYWATRIDPMWADAYYARRVALLLSDHNRLISYWQGDRRTVEQSRWIDSLMYRALTINPFLSRRLDKKMFDAVIDEAIRRSGSNDAGALRYEIDLMTQRWPPASRAWLAYGDGLSEQALRLYGDAISRDKNNPAHRIDRARVYFNMNMPDSALTDLTTALDLLQKADKKDLVFVYQSRAFIEHCLAVVYQRLDKLPAAKEAFGRALQEDLSYYPAHMQLAFMALDAKDTTTALAELDLATQLRGDDPGTQYAHGYALVLAGRAGDADAHLKKAIALDPSFAAPKFVLARLFEVAGFTDEAISTYKDFLAAAARSDPRRPQAETRLAELAKPPSLR